jgi:hypothetical protein
MKHRVKVVKKYDIKKHKIKTLLLSNSFRPLSIFSFLRLKQLPQYPKTPKNDHAAYANEHPFCRQLTRQTG